MQNFQNQGACGVVVTIFDETPKGTSLSDFTGFELLCVQIRSGVFARRDHEIKGHYKKL